jgi:hypothetical protein
MSLNRKINTLSIAILILLMVTVSLQSLMRSDQVRRKGVADQNFRGMFSKLDSIIREQSKLNSRFDSLQRPRH